MSLINDELRFSRTRRLAAIAVFAAVAAVIRLQSKVLSLPFPLMPALKLEIWEIPVALGLLLYGPTVGFSAGVVVLAIGLMIGSNPTGQVYNFIAFSSMLLGMTLANRIYSRSRRFNLKGSVLTSTLGGVVVRVAVMVPLMLVMLPLPPPLGFNIPLWSNPLLLRGWVVSLILFNSLVAAYTIPLSYVIEEALVKRLTPFTWIRLPLVRLQTLQSKEHKA
ncbi:MAG: ECF transporter S component [Nitrososphaerales archaeon]